MAAASWVLAAFAVALGSLGCRKPPAAFEMFATPPAGTMLPRYWPVPEFTLIERSRETVTLADLRGKVWVGDFFYTTCPGPCPMMTSRLSEIHKATRNLDDVRLVSISIDPAKDTPDVLQQYAASFGADSKWLFLTGEKAAIYQLAIDGFKLSVTEQGGTEREPITHSTKLVLVDKNSTVRGFYEGTTPAETQRLLGDIERLRKESR